MFQPLPPPRFKIANRPLYADDENEIDDEPNPDLPNIPGFSRTYAARRHLLMDDAAKALPELPPPGAATHLLMSGRYDLMHMIVRVIEENPPCHYLRIATLSLNLRNVAEIVRLKQTNAIDRASLVCSQYFATADKDTYHKTAQQFANHGFRIAAPRCHAKVVTLHFSDGTKYAMEGSANLRTNKNFEQLTVINDHATHDWHANWIDSVLDTHEIHES